MLLCNVWQAWSPFECGGSAILWYLSERMLVVSVVFKSQWEKPLKPALVVKFLCSPYPWHHKPTQLTSWARLACPQFVCMWTCMEVGVIVPVYAHFAFPCATLRASWVVPGAPGTWPIAFPAEVGAAAAVRKHTDEEPDLLSVEDQTWLVVFSDKPPRPPWRDRTTSPTLFDFPPSKSPTQEGVHLITVELTGSVHVSYSVLSLLHKMAHSMKE